MLFTFRTYVDEKKLGRALAALDGIATQIDAPQPVRNAQHTNGTLQSTTKGSILDITLPPKGSIVTNKQIGDLIEAAGFQRSSTNYTVNRLVSDKRLARTAKHGSFKVR